MNRISLRSYVWDFITIKVIKQLYNQIWWPRVNSKIGYFYLVSFPILTIVPSLVVYSIATKYYSLVCYSNMFQVGKCHRNELFLVPLAKGRQAIVMALCRCASVRSSLSMCVRACVRKLFFKKLLRN